MPPSQRITIRVPPDLLTTLESHLRPGEALSDIVRRALQDYVGRLSDTGSERMSDGVSDMTNVGDVRAWMAQITQRLEVLSDTVRHLAVAQGSPQRQDTATPQAPRQDPILTQIQRWQAEGMTLR